MTQTPSQDAREALAKRFKYEHQNACYPDATDFEALEAADQFISIFEAHLRSTIASPAGEVGEMIERLRFELRDWNGKSRTHFPQVNALTLSEAAAMLERLAASKKPPQSGDSTEAMRLFKDLPIAVKLAGAEAITLDHMNAKANYDAACDCWDAIVAALTKGGAA